MPSYPNLRPALLSLLVVQLFFGSLPVMGKLAIPAFGAGGVAFFRIAGGAVVFQLLRMGGPSVPWREQPKILLCAILGIAGNQLLFLYGLQYTRAVNATLIITLVPVLTYAVALLFGMERWVWRRVAGIGVGLAGVALLVAGDVGGGELIGDLLILGNTTAYALYLVISRPLLERLSPLTVVAWLFTWSVPITLVVVGLPTLPAWDAVAGVGAQMEVPVWATMIYIIAGPTVGAYYLNLYALRAVPSSTVALFIYLQPFVTTALSIPLLGEIPGPRTLICAVISFVGVWLATRPAAAA